MARLVHETSYRKGYLGGYVHRARLRAIQGTLRRFKTEAHRSWADFGCSNGFVIESVLAAGGVTFDRIAGFDFVTDLLDLARQKGLPNAEFHEGNLNTVTPAAEQFDLVTCFETLEHVANFRAAFQNLYNHLSPGGVLVIAVPNETGFPGLLKFGARRLVQRDPYGDFFKGSSAAAYTWRLLSNGYIDDFRKPTDQGYGPHLGFDYRRLVAHINDAYVTGGQLHHAETRKTLLGMNVLCVFSRPAV